MKTEKQKQGNNENVSIIDLSNIPKVQMLQMKHINPLFIGDTRPKLYIPTLVLIYEFSISSRYINIPKRMNV